MIEKGEEINHSSFHIGLQALTELNPERKWNFIKVNFSSIFIEKKKRSFFVDRRQFGTITTLSRKCDQKCYLSL